MADTQIFADLRVQPDPRDAKALDELLRDIRALNKELGRSEKQSDRAFDAAGKDARKAAGDVGKLEKQTESLNEDLTETGKAGDGLSGLINSLGDVAGELGSLSPLSAGALGGIAALGAGIVSTTQDVIQSVNAFRELQREIQGLTGLQGDPLRDITAQVKTVEETYGLGAEQLTLAARNLAASQGININRALDLLQEGVARGLNEEGLRQIEEYSIFLRQAGLEAEQAVSFIQQSNQAGFFDDKAVDALKEASISLGELTQASRDALQPLGEEFANNLFESLNDPAAEASLFDAIQQVSSRAFEQGLNRQEISTLIADVFRGAGEDAGGEELLKFFAQLDRASLNLRGELSALQKQQQANAQVNQQINESYGRISERLLESGGSVETLSLRFKAFALSLVEDLLPVIESTLDFFSALFERFLEFANFLKRSRIARLIKNIAVAIGAYVAATKAAALATRLFGAASSKLKTAFTGLRGTIRNAGAAVRSFNKAIASNAIGLAAAAIALLIQNWDELTRAITGATNAQREFNQQQSDLRAEVVENEVAIEKQIKTVRDGQATLQERQKALNELVKQAPEVVNQLAAQNVNVEGARVGQDTDVIDRFLKEVSNFTNEIAQNRVVETAASGDGINTFAFDRLLELGLAEGATEEDLRREIGKLAEAQTLLARQETAGNESAVERQVEVIDSIQERIDDLVDGETDVLFGLLQSSASEDFNVDQIIRGIARKSAAESLGLASIQVQQETPRGGARRPPNLGGGVGGEIEQAAPKEIEIDLTANVEPLEAAVEQARESIRGLEQDERFAELDFEYSLRQSEAGVGAPEIADTELLRQERELADRRSEIALEIETDQLRRQNEQARQAALAELDQQRAAQEARLVESIADEEALNRKRAELEKTYQRERSKIDSAAAESRAAVEEQIAERSRQTQAEAARRAALNRLEIARREAEAIAELERNIAQESRRLKEFAFEGANEQRQRQLVEEQAASEIATLEEQFEKEVNLQGLSQSRRLRLIEAFNAERVRISAEAERRITEINRGEIEKRNAARKEALARFREDITELDATLTRLSETVGGTEDTAGGAFLAGLPGLINEAAEDIGRVRDIQGEQDLLVGEQEGLQREKETLIEEARDLRRRFDEALASGDKDGAEVLKKRLEETQGAIDGTNEKLRQTQEELDALDAEGFNAKFNAIADAISGISSLVFDAIKAASEAAIQSIDAALERQRSSVSEIREGLKQGGEAAQNLSAELLEAEERRLEELNKMRQREIERQRAAASIELVLQSSIAIAKAAAAGGSAAPFTIAATLAALAIGLAKAKAQAEQAVPTAETGAKVLDGGRIRKADGKVVGPRHKDGGVLLEVEGGETIFSRDHSQAFAPLFDGIHSGAVSPRSLDMLRLPEDVRAAPFRAASVLAPQINVDNSGVEQRLDRLEATLAAVGDKISRDQKFIISQDAATLGLHVEKAQKRALKQRKGRKI